MIPLVKRIFFIGISFCSMLASCIYVSQEKPDGIKDTVEIVADDTLNAMSDSAVLLVDTVRSDSLMIPQEVLKQRMYNRRRWLNLPKR